eukprot:SAG11_NODE_789_length_7139_cov_5.205607_2_plen_100_part_00
MPESPKKRVVTVFLCMILLGWCHRGFVAVEKSLRSWRAVKLTELSSNVHALLAITVTSWNILPAGVVVGSAQIKVSVSPATALIGSANLGSGINSPVVL